MVRKGRVVAKAKRVYQRRRRGIKQRPQNTGFGGLIARGVRTLLSVLPGSKLTTGIADFVFGNLGYAPKTLSIGPNGEVSADILVTGLAALFHLALKDILFESFTHGTRVDTGKWTSNYLAGRLRSVIIKVIPQAPRGTQLGQYAVGFIPFRSDTDQKYYNGEHQALNYEQVKMLPGAKSGFTSSQLSVSYRPKSSDGRLFFNVPLTEEIGAVAIGFDQTSRSDYGNFSMDQFSCTVLVSGVVALERPKEYGSGVYSRKLDDKVTNTTLVMTPDHELSFTVQHVDECVDTGSSVRISGLVVPHHLARVRGYMEKLHTSITDGFECVSIDTP